MPDTVHTTALAVEKYIEQHLFDESGLMYCGIDSHTDKPFAREFITACKVGRDTERDPWIGWTYEDSIASMGLYLDGLVLQYEVTGDDTCLQRAQRIWTIIERVYSCSQVYGIGSFLRPYGGFLQMGNFMEPLGTDQASPLFCGLYRYLAHVDGDRADDIRRVMFNTLKWYEQQGFKYFYHKSFIHGGMRSTCHSNSYYLPAVAWAASFSDDPRWQGYLNLRLGLYEKGDAEIWARKGILTMNWGSDLPILRRILGPRFDKVFSEKLLDEAYATWKVFIAEYEQPGMIRRICPESAKPGFKPYLVEPDLAKDGENRTLLGCAEFYQRHHGRERLGQTFLLALAAIGYRTAETVKQASELLALRSRVPSDFTAWLSEDYDRLPDTVHINARSVGVGMVIWWREYWLLRSIQKK